MRIPDYPKAYHQFIIDTLDTAKNNGVNVRFSAKSLVYSDPTDKIGSSGYFSSEPLELAIAVKSNKSTDWLDLMVHESCHMDQYLENKVTWDVGSVSYIHFYSWLEGALECPDHELQTAVDGVIDVELDCERRSVAKIKKYNLPIDLVKYKKKANSYLYAIRFFSYKREWYNKIYLDGNVWQIAPTNFKKSYATIPKKLYDAYERYATSQ